MHVVERLEHHELGAQQPDAIDVACRDLRGPLRLGEIDVESRRGDEGAAQRMPRMRATPATACLNVGAPLVRSTTVPAPPSTVTTFPSTSARVASCAPTMHGSPSSRATIAACDVMPPASVTIAAARRMIGTQSGDVMRVTSISPACIADSSLGDSRTRTAPIARSGARAQSVDEGFALAWRRRTARRGCRLQRRDRPALRQIDRVALDRELEVLRHADSASRRAGPTRRVPSTLRWSARAPSHADRAPDRFEWSRALTESHASRNSFSRDLRHQHGERRLVEHVAIGRDRSLHHRFAQSPRRLDDDARWNRASPGRR